MPYAQDDPNHLGQIYLHRRDAIAPEPTLDVVLCDDGRVRYRDGRGSRVILRPTDRKSGRVVMEDDTPEKQAALRNALAADGWATIQARG